MATEKIIRDISDVQVEKFFHLSLSDNYLAALPAEIFHFTNLTSLGLSENELHGLPAEIAMLTKLTFLDVSFLPDKK